MLEGQEKATDSTEPWRPTARDITREEAKAVLNSIGGVLATVPMVAADHRRLVAAMDFIRREFGINQWA